MKLQKLIGEDWFNVLNKVFKGTSFKKIEDFLIQIVRSKSEIYPELTNIFKPFSECPYRDLKVVILNNAPFHDRKANDGLAFSVSNPNADIPKDAVAFLEGIEQDVKEGFDLHKDYDLRRLAKQGVLLLNASATVTVKDGEWTDNNEIWKSFIREVLTTICEYNTGIVFIFVGIKDFSYFSQPIIHSKNYIITCMHPGEANHFAQVFNPSHVFKLTNMLLKANNNTQIEW